MRPTFVLSFLSSPMTQWIPEADSQQMEKTYVEHPAAMAAMDPRAFVDTLELRLYSEWMRDPGNHDQSALYYDGQGYRDWVNQETHLALERRGAEQLQNEE